MRHGALQGQKTKHDGARMRGVAAWTMMDRDRRKRRSGDPVD